MWCTKSNNMGLSTRVPISEQDMNNLISSTTLNNYALGKQKDQNFKNMRCRKSSDMGEYTQVPVDEQDIIPSESVKNPTMISYPIMCNIDPPSLTWFGSKFKYYTNIPCANTDCHQPASQCEYRMVSYTNESLFNNIYVLPICQDCNYPFELAQVFSHFIDNYVAGTIKIHLSANEE